MRNSRTLAGLAAVWTALLLALVLPSPASTAADVSADRFWPQWRGPHATGARRIRGKCELQRPRADDARDWAEPARPA